LSVRPVLPDQKEKKQTRGVLEERKGQRAIWDLATEERGYRLGAVKGRLGPTPRKFKGSIREETTSEPLRN